MAAVRKTATVPKKARRTRMDVDQRRAQLVELGQAFFSAAAYDQVSIDDVAKAAGISKGLLFHYFPSKRAFYVATVEERARYLLETTRAPAAGTPQERLRAGVDGYLRFVSEQGASYAALIRSGVGVDPAVGRIVEETRRRFLHRVAVDVGVEPPPPPLRAALRGWLGCVEAMALDYVENQDVELVVLRNILLDALEALVRPAMARVV